MDYEYAWNEMKEWLNGGIRYMEGCLKEQQQFEFPSGRKEYERIKAKLDGMKTCFEHMDDSERIYKQK